MKKEKIHIDKIEEKTPKKNSLGKRLLKISAYTLASFIFIITLAFFMFDRVVKLTIEDQFNERSEGNYELHIEDLKTNLFDESVLSAL